jgi:hypothetical protein
LGLRYPRIGRHPREEAKERHADKCDNEHDRKKN